MDLERPLSGKLSFRFRLITTGLCPKRKLILVFMFSHSQILGEQSISYCEFEHCGHRRGQGSIVWTYVLHK